MNDIGVIHLSNGGFTIVDADLFPLLNSTAWQRSTSGGVYRSQSRFGKTETVLMHRVVNETPNGVITDHRNRCRIDNTRRNLRNSTKSLNAGNSMPRKRKPGGPVFKGVFYRKDLVSKPWAARIGSDKTLKHLGYFETEELAAEAYNRAAIARYGHHALLNEVKT